MQRGAASWAAAIVLCTACVEPHPRTPPPPATTARRVAAVEETAPGERLADPYAWMEEESEELRSWVEAQDARTRAYLASALEASQGLRERARRYELAAQDSTPVRRGNRFFLMRSVPEGGGAALYLRIGASDTRLAGPESFTEIGIEGAQIADFRVDPDGSRVAVVAESPATGRRLAGVVRAGDGTFLPDRIEGAELARGPWLPDGSGFVYATRPSAERPGGLWVHRLGSAADRRLGMPGDNGQARARVHVADERGNLVVVETDPSRARRAYRLTAESDWRETADLIALPAGSRLDYLGSTPGKLELFHAVSPEGSERVVACAGEPATAPRTSDLLDLGTQGVSSVHHFGGRIVVNGLEEGKPVLRVHDLEGDLLATLTPPFGLLWTNFPPGRPPLFGDPGSRYAYLSSLALSAPGIYELDVEGLTLEPWRLRGGIESSQVVVRRVSYRSSDGVEIPMSLVHLPGVEMDATAPALVWVYGAHAFVATPYFNGFFRAFVEMGGVFAMPQVRGGGVFGPRWHEAGSRANKLNTVADTIAALQWLIQHRVTRAEQLAVLGNSAGTVPAAAAAIERPELLAALILEVPLADLVRHPLWSGGWSTEFGDPAIPEELAALLRFSPYELVQHRRPLPPTLIFAGEHDEVAPPQHAYKLAASMQHAQVRREHPILLYLVRGAGHQIGVDAAQRQESRDYQMAFLYATLKPGIPAATSPATSPAQRRSVAALRWGA